MTLFRHTVFPRYSRFHNSRYFDRTYLPRITRATCTTKQYEADIMKPLSYVVTLSCLNQNELEEITERLSEMIARPYLRTPRRVIIQTVQLCRRKRQVKRFFFNIIEKMKLSRDLNFIKLECTV